MPTINTQAAVNKLRYRMRQVLSYRLQSSLSNTRIAELVGLSVSGLDALMKHPEYLEMEEAAMEGKIDELDQKLSDDKEELRKQFKYAVPAALTALVETVKQRRDLRARLAAAKEILDRDPDAEFVGVKKSEQTGQEGGPQLPSDIVASLQMEGNRTVAHIKAGSGKGAIRVSVQQETTDVIPPDAGKHNA